MFKLLVLSCLLASCLADPFGLPSWLREAGRRPRPPRGCRDRAEGWRACARRNDSSALAPHSTDCSVFFYCRRGARPACRRCPAGLHFNPQLQVCDWPANVECSPRPPHPPCPPRPSRPPHDSSSPYPTTPDAETSVPVSDSPSSSPPEPSPDPSTDAALTSEATSTTEAPFSTTAEAPVYYTESYWWWAFK